MLAFPECCTEGECQENRPDPHPLGRVTIAGHPNDDLAPGTLNSVLKQARLKEAK